MVQTKCEVYSRVVGYIRPVEQWHDGKQQEFRDRKQFVSKEKQEVFKVGATRKVAKTDSRHSV